ncbi:MAG: C25 family cysteine peptidase, partial [bacterium]
MKNTKSGQNYALVISLFLISPVFNQSGFSNSQFIKSKQPVFYSETWLDNSRWIWQGSIGEPDLFITAAGFTSIHTEALENDSRLAYPSLPYFNKIFNAMPEDISYHINGSSLVVLPVNGKLERFSDRSKPDNAEFEFADISNPDIGNLYPRETVIITFLGYVDNLPLTSVTIYPYQLIDNGQQLRYYEELNVSLSIADNSTLRELQISEKSNLEKALNLNNQVRRLPSEKTLLKQGTHFLYGKNMMRITVDSTGIYRISQSTLKDNGAAVKKVDPRTFQMFNKGLEVPIYIKGESDGSFDKSDYIEFYGQRNPNSVADYCYDPFTDKNVYFLTWGVQNGLRYAEESAKTTISTNDAIVPSDYEYTSHFEVNSYFDRLGRVDTDLPTHTRDHWFFDSGINGGTTRSYNFQLIHPNVNISEPFNIEVGMHGLTYQEGNHTVTVYINDYFTTSDSWRDQVPYIIRNYTGQTLQNRYLRHGENKIQLAVAGDDPTNKYDKVLFDYLNIRYKRLYQAYKERIDFNRPEKTPTGTYHFKISGFENPDISVYKIGKSKLMDFSVEYSTLTDNYSVLVEDYIHDDNTFYIAASQAGTMQPLSIQADTIFNISAEENPVDLLIISDQQFKYNLSKLISYYQSVGINARVVGIRDIYNEFNDGIVSPYAIRDYLAFIHENWTHKPQSVLLIGDSGIREQESVPAFFNQSYKYGACASDHWYVALEEKSGIPEYAIGRWPVSNQEELELLIDKRINYTNNAPVGPWRNEMLYIAGYEDVFKNQTENMIQRQIPKEFSINRIFINPSSVKTLFFGGSDTLIYLFNEGLTLINFMGHGGGGVWSDRSLFNTSHIEYLDNYDKLPFITSLTCFTSDFASMTGLGGHLLLAENGGAIGLWGATSVGWIKNDYLMAKPFYDVIFEPGMTVGEAIQYAKI